MAKTLPAGEAEAPPRTAPEPSARPATDRHRLSPWRITDGAPLFPLVVLFGLNAVDELDRAAFQLLSPEIRDHFGMSDQGILAMVALVAPLAIVAAVPLAYWADRYRRTWIAAGGATCWAGFSVFSGLAPNPGTLTVARAGAGLGKGVNDPTHNSLIADYYPVEVRAKVFACHRAANSVGQMLGPILAGLLAFLISWRAPFVLFAIPTLIFVFLASRLREPVRGAMERRAGGADEETAAVEDPPPSFGDAWRLLYNIPTLRRAYAALPFFAASGIGTVALMSLFYEEAYGLNEVTRGVLFAAEEPWQILGLVVGTPLAHRLLRRDPALALKFLALVAVGVAGAILVVATSPNVAVAVAGSWARAFVGAILLPVLLAVFSLVIPPRTRAMGFAAVLLWMLPGLIALPIIGGISDTYGIRVAILLLIPLYGTGALILASGHGLVKRDIENNQRWSALEAEARKERERLRSAVEAGEIPASDFPLLDVRDVSFSYDSAQVLFDVELQVPRGGAVALLGTNGAGKSTLLRVISGLEIPDPGSGGSIWFEGEDITYALPEDRASMGMLLVPGGKATFPSLTVAENLRLGAYPLLRDADVVDSRVAEVCELFPVLGSRAQQPAGTLSGGEQQLMAIARALIGRPRLLMIDELSLGLAPVVMQEVLRMVDEILARGTTLILVEQSLDVAANMTEHAYFMEKGEIRFSGPTEDLLSRGDLARSVFFGTTPQPPDDPGSAS